MHIGAPLELLGAIDEGAKRRPLCRLVSMFTALLHRADDRSTALETASTSAADVFGYQWPCPHSHSVCRPSMQAVSHSRATIFSSSLSVLHFAMCSLVIRSIVTSRSKPHCLNQRLQGGGEEGKGGAKLKKRMSKKSRVTWSSWEIIVFPSHHFAKMIKNHKKINIILPFWGFLGCCSPGVPGGFPRATPGRPDSYQPPSKTSTGCRLTRRPWRLHAL